ncbi:MAG: hypothetical protein M1358_15690 [Chloroflexi bacterium]|nr:hypothetical protein [Chloroflexota bacterium]
MDLSPTLYEETVPLGRLASGLIVGGLVAVAAIPVIIFATEGVRSDAVALVIPAVVFVFLALVFWNYRAIHIRLTTDRFEARYGIFNRTSIPWAEIAACEPITASFARYGGIGVRLGSDGSWAYTTSFGPAIRLKRRKGRGFVVSTNRQEELGHIIESRIRDGRAQEPRDGG